MYCFDAVKFDKAKAMIGYNLRLRGAAKLLRLLELCAALLVLSWCSTRLPLALHFFRWISGFFAAHVFFFFLCNAIILSLLANSGWLSDQLASAPGSSAGAAEDDLYDELIKNSTDRSNSVSEFHGRSLPEETVFHDKEIIEEVPVRAIPVEDTDTNLNFDLDLDFPKNFRRTKSEIKYLAKSANNMCAVLRRSETQICREMVSDGGEEHGEEEMSNEEFQKTIEAFIAKQLKFRRQESTAGVLIAN